MQIAANGIKIEYQQYGPLDGIPLILIRGLGTPMSYWPANFLSEFANLGYRTIIFDNRDIGLSQRCPDPNTPVDADVILTQLDAGQLPKPAYHLEDMARDVIGLMDGLKVQKAHVFGISMGGGIAQILACEYASRLLSATMVMTSAHFNGLSKLTNLLARPETRLQFQQSWVDGNHLWGGTDYRVSEDELRVQAGIAWDQGCDPDGVNRQCLAMIQSPDRRNNLRDVSLPCLVIHGTQDNLVSPADGRQVADLIPGANFIAIEGMGHAITPPLAPVMIHHVHAFIESQQSD